MDLTFGTLVFALFIIGVTIFIIAENNDEAAWWYIAILLLGMMLAPFKDAYTGDSTTFASELLKVGFP